VLKASVSSVDAARDPVGREHARDGVADPSDAGDDAGVGESARQCPSDVAHGRGELLGERAAQILLGVRESPCLGRRSGAEHLALTAELLVELGEDDLLRVERLVVIDEGLDLRLLLGGERHADAGERADSLDRVVQGLADLDGGVLEALVAAAHRGVEVDDRLRRRLERLGADPGEREEHVLGALDGLVVVRREVLHLLGELADVARRLAGRPARRLDDGRRPALYLIELLERRRASRERLGEQGYPAAHGHGTGNRADLRDRARGMGHAAADLARARTELRETAFELAGGRVDPVGGPGELVLELQRGDEARGIAERH
jgi:hypothetical protein